MGRSLQEIALANAVAEATLRSQLRSIRAKTGKRRQAEIVGLALAGVSLDLDPVSD